MADTPDIIDAFAIALRHFREREGFSQEEMTQHQTYISRLELGEQNPSLRILHQLSQDLDVPLSEMFAFTESLMSESSSD